MAAGELLVPVLIALISGPALGVLVNYLLGRRKANLEDKQNSGSVSSSEATELWSQTRTLLDQYQKDRQDERNLREKLEERLAENNKQLFEVMQQMRELQESNSELKISNNDLMSKLKEFEKVVAKLTKENERLLKLRKVEDNNG